MADVTDLQKLVTERLAELGDRRGPLSTRQAALRSDGLISYETLRLLAEGQHSGRLKDDTVAGLALALDVPRSKVLAAMGRSITQPLGRFELPERADYLTRPQRRAVLSVIDAILGAAQVPGEAEAKEQATNRRKLEVAERTRTPGAQPGSRRQTRPAR